MKRLLLFVVAMAVLLATLAACGGNPKAGKSGESIKTDTKTGTESGEKKGQDAGGETPDESSAGESRGSAEKTDVLVVYFSATGTTKGVAEMIASITGADLYEIKAAKPYSSDDLNYNNSASRATKEQNDKKVRPEIGSEDLSLEGYKTVYLGFPIWWGEEPRIMDTFVESHSFDGITMIPFCTSSSSGIGRSGQNLADNAGSGTWLEGKRFGGGASEDEIRSWIEGLQ